MCIVFQYSEKLRCLLHEKHTMNLDLTYDEIESVSFAYQGLQAKIYRCVNPFHAE